MSLGFIGKTLHGIGHSLGSGIRNIVSAVSGLGEAVIHAPVALWHSVWDYAKDLLGVPDPADYEGLLVTKTGTVEFLPVIYGRRSVGGTVLHMETAGSSNEYLWIAYALCDADNPVEQIDQILVNDTVVFTAGASVSSRFDGNILIEYTLGDHVTQPFPTLESGSAGLWTAERLVLNTCAVAIRFKWDKDKFSGAPKVVFTVKGMKVLDVNKLPSDTTRYYSVSPADHLFDYLTNPIYGKGLSITDGVDLDLASFRSAKTYGEQLVDPWYGAVAQHTRFEQNAVVSGGKPLVGNIRNLLVAMRGTLPYSQGLFYCLVDRDYAASEYPGGAYYDFNESNIVGGWTFASGDVTTRYNRIKVTFPNEDPKFNYKPDYVVVQSEAFRRQDGGRLLETTANFANITNQYRVLDIGSILLRKSRNQIAAKFVAMPSAIEVTAGTIVTITHSTPGWSGKLFRATKVEPRPDGLVSVSVTEHEPTSYDLSLPNEIPTSPDTNLPDVTVVPDVTGLALVSDESVLIIANDGTLVPRIHCTWTPSTNIFVDGYDIEYKRSVDPDSKYVPAGSPNSVTTDEIYIENVTETVDYDVRIRARNSAGFSGAWTSVLNHTVIGKTSNPADVVGFNFALSKDGVTLSWTKNTDKDLAKYEVRVGGTAWGTGDSFLLQTDTTKYTVQSLVTGSNVFRIKAIDTGGRYSTNAVTTATTLVVTAPSAPTVTASLSGSDLIVDWSDATQSFDIDKYILKYQNGTSTAFDTATLLTETKSNTFSMQLTTNIQRTYMVEAVDIFGNVGSVGSVTYTPSSQTTIAFQAFAISNQNVTLSWNDPSNELPIVEYILKEGSSWTLASEVVRTKSLSYTITGSWGGDKTFWIAAVDSAQDAMNRASGTLDNHGTEASQIVTLNPPNQVSVGTPTFSEGSIVFSWGAPISDLPIDYYILTRGSSRVVIDNIKSTSYSLIPDWSGLEYFYVTPVNTAGISGTESQIDATVIVPNAPTIGAYSIVSDRVEFSWSYPAGTNDYTGSLPVKSYDIRYDGGTGTFSAATPILVTGTDAFSRKVDWANVRRFWVTPIDSSGNFGTSSVTSVTIGVPNPVSILPQVVDNNVLLNWTDATNTLPIDHYEIRRGVDYATAEIIGTLLARFTVIFETVSGTFVYWVTGYDTAGNAGTSVQISVGVSEPPDYVLYSAASDTGFTGTKTNVYVNSNGDLNLPVNTTETVADHFVNNSWDQPIDQINAGYPIYIEPTPTTASYVRQWDLGVTLQNLSVTMDITYAVIDGNIVLSDTAASRWSMYISTSTDGTTWTDYPVNSFKIFAPNFRYIKVTVDVVTDTGDDLLEITDIRYTVDVKERTDAGTGTVTTASAGAVVTFNKAFADISSLTVTPSFDTAGGGTLNSVYAIYDFEDVPNPTSFKVYLYDQNGTQITGNFSWNARGH